MFSWTDRSLDLIVWIWGDIDDSTQIRRPTSPGVQHRLVARTLKLSQTSAKEALKQPYPPDRDTAPAARFLSS